MSGSSVAGADLFGLTHLSTVWSNMNSSGDDDDSSREAVVAMVVPIQQQRGVYFIKATRHGATLATDDTVEARINSFEGSYHASCNPNKTLTLRYPNPPFLIAAITYLAVQHNYQPILPRAASIP
jgi:hypothetical protein